MKMLFRNGYSMLCVAALFSAAVMGCQPASDTSEETAAPTQNPAVAEPAPTDAAAAPAEPAPDTAEAPAADQASLPPLGEGAKAFASRDEAMEALVQAARDNDRDAIAEMMGAGFDEIVPEGSVDEEDKQAFLAAYDEKHWFNEENGASYIAVGDDEWAFPVPIVEENGSWHYDLAAGAEEVLVRAVGRNELDTMQACLAYSDAQKDYASVDRNGDGVLEYAQKIGSTEGQHDGLYWPSAEGEELSPLGRLYAEATGQGSYSGYHYRILTSQGDNAPAGKINYIIGGRMTGGYALIAWPEVYGETGITTFMINHDGVLYEKDLGADTATAVEQITSYDPDDTWKKVEEVTAEEAPAETEPQA